MGNEGRGKDLPGGVSGEASPEMPAPGVKVCGLTRRDDARRAAEAGADYLGVILVPGTPRAVSGSQGRAVVEGLGVPVVGVVADLSPARTGDQARELGAGVVQLHGREDPEFVRALRDEGPWEIWKALRVRDTQALLSELCRFAPLVDGILLDSWHPLRRGGTGTPFSWADVARIRDAFPNEAALVAAGGLNPGNVAEAIRHLRPHVVDVSSGVEESPGIKSHEKIVAFIQAAKGIQAAGETRKEDR